MDDLKCRDTKVLLDNLGTATKRLDSIALLGHVNIELSLKCQDCLRALSSPALKPTCNCTHPLTNLLFGEDLTKTIFDSRAENHRSRNTPKPCYRLNQSQSCQQNKPFFCHIRGGSCILPTPTTGKERISKYLVNDFKGKRISLHVRSIGYTILTISTRLLAVK